MVKQKTSDYRRSLHSLAKEPPDSVGPGLELLGDTEKMSKKGYVHKRKLP